MSGFPGRPARVDFGPEMKNVRPPVIPETDLSAGQMNLTFWQAAGASRTLPMGVILYDGNTEEILHQAMAFDPRQELAAPVTAVRTGVGTYEFTFAFTYQDERGVDIAFTPSAALALVQAGAPQDYANVTAVGGSQVVAVALLQPGPVAVDGRVFLTVW